MTAAMGQTATPPVAAPPPPSPTASQPPEGLSAFLARVLDQLSVSAWLPSALLVFGGYLLGHLRRSDGHLGPALEGVGATRFEALVMLLAAVIVLTTVTQAFEYGAIRVLEGYWGFGRVRQWLADLLAHRYVVREARASAVRSQLVQRAFQSARPGFVRAVNDMTIVDFIEADILDRNAKPVLTSAQEQEMDQLDWRTFASPAAMRRLGEHERQIRQLPSSHRIMPTLLGNTLRSHEDRASGQLGGSVQGMVHRTYHRLPLHLQVEIDQFRNRLGLYASLVATTALLVLSSAVVVMPVDVTSGAIAASGGLVLAVVFYRASVSSAEAYGGLLEEVAELASRGEIADPIAR